MEFKFYFKQCHYVKLLAFSNHLIEYLDLICQTTNHDLIPLISQGDLFLESLEHAMLSFLRHGCMTHILGLQPYSFNQFNRAVILLEGLLGKCIWNFLYILCFDFASCDVYRARLILDIFISVPYKATLSSNVCSTVVSSRGLRFLQLYDRSATFEANNYRPESTIAGRTLVHVSFSKIVLYFLFSVFAMIFFNVYSL